MKLINKILIKGRQITLMDYLLCVSYFVAAINLFVACIKSKNIMLLYISIVLFLVFFLKLTDKRKGMRGLLPTILSIVANIFVTIIFLNPVMLLHNIVMLLIFESIILLCLFLVIKQISRRSINK